MAEPLTLRLSKRAVIGKKVKQLRRGGAVPVHLYGSGLEPLSLQVETGVLRRLLPRAGMNIPIAVEVDGRDGENICFIREVQRHPVTEDVLHVDFLRVDVSQTITAEVPIVLTGEAPSVINMGGTLFQTIQAATVEALPMTIPSSFTIDVSDLDDFEKAVRIADLDVGANVTVLHEPDDMIARVLAPRLEEEEAAAEEEEIEGEVAEGEEGAEAPATEASEKSGQRS
jgi:large subunit ribosomal protein L25